MKPTKEEFARAREAFEAWAKSQRGMGIAVWESETISVQKAVPVPFDWDDLDSDQQEVWIDVSRAFDPVIEEQCEAALTGANEAHLEAERDLKETHAGELSAIGERLGLLGPDLCGAPTGKASNRCLRAVNHSGGHDCQTLIETAPSAEEIIERVQLLLTDGQNQAKQIAELTHQRDEARGANDALRAEVANRAEKFNEAIVHVDAADRAALIAIAAVQHTQIGATLQRLAEVRGELEFARIARFGGKRPTLSPSVETAAVLVLRQLQAALPEMDDHDTPVNGGDAVDALCEVWPLLQQVLKDTTILQPEGKVTT